MTTLLATPIKMSEPGSHRARQRLLDVAEALEDAQATGKSRDYKAAYIAMEQMMLPYLRTDDGTPVTEAMEQVSGDQFIELYRSLIGVETVGEATSAP